MEDPTNRSGNTVANNGSMDQKESPHASTTSPFLKPDQDQASDNEASEGPVREKLKKTSLASIPRQNGSAAEVELDNAEMTSTTAQNVEERPQAVGEGPEIDRKGRGRPTKKRSFDDLNADKGEALGEAGQGIISTPGRARKRSKDVQTSTSPRPSSHEDTNMTNEEQQVDEKHLAVETDKEPRNVAIDTIQPPVDTKLADEDMHSAFSPRKKRSRDQMEAETQREQKIPATEEAKAHRRSEEQEREQRFLIDNKSPAKDGISTNIADTNTTQPVVHTAGEDKKGGFTNTSATSPFGALAGAESAPRPSSHSVEGPKVNSSEKASDTTTPSAFLSGSTSASPFGSLGPSPFGGSKSFGSSSFSGGGSATSSGWAAKGSQQAVSNGFATGSATALAANPNVMAPSPFNAGASAPKSKDANGKPVFGSGFGQASGFGGPKLSSFANPAGGDLPRSKPSAIKPMGTGKGSDDEEGESDGDGEEDNKEVDTQEEETDPRFHHQQMDTGEEGEESIFSSSRAKLYGWEAGAWKERGAGVLRFNVTTSDSADSGQQEGRARFIMRAHQTYRILLNTPVFKQMTIGDPTKKGEEPTAKSLGIAVVTEGGKPSPYLIRLSDNNEAKALYREESGNEEALFASWQRLLPPPTPTGQVKNGNKTTPWYESMPRDPQRPAHSTFSSLFFHVQSPNSPKAVRSVVWIGTCPTATCLTVSPSHRLTTILDRRNDNLPPSASRALVGTFPVPEDEAMIL